RALQWEAGAYYRDVRNLITFDEFDDATNQSVATNTAGKVTMRGVQLDLKVPLAAAFDAGLSYSYNRSRAVDTDLQLTRIPQSQAKAVLDYSPTDHPFGATVTVDHV